MLTYSCLSRLYTTGIGRQVKSPPSWLLLTPSKELELVRCQESVSERKKKPKQKADLEGF